MYFCQLVLGKKFQNKAKLFNAKIKSLVTLLEIFKMSISIFLYINKCVLHSLIIERRNKKSKGRPQQFDFLYFLLIITFKALIHLFRN